MRFGPFGSDLANLNVVWLIWIRFGQLKWGLVLLVLIWPKIRPTCMRFGSIWIIFGQFECGLVDLDHIWSTQMRFGSIGPFWFDQIKWGLVLIWPTWMTFGWFGSDLVNSNEVWSICIRLGQLIWGLIQLDLIWLKWGLIHLVCDLVNLNVVWLIWITFGQLKWGLVHLYQIRQT